MTNFNRSGFSVQIIQQLFGVLLLLCFQYSKLHSFGRFFSFVAVHCTFSCTGITNYRRAQKRNWAKTQPNVWMKIKMHNMAMAKPNRRQNQRSKSVFGGIFFVHLSFMFWVKTFDTIFFSLLIAYSLFRAQKLMRIHCMKQRHLQLQSCVSLSVSIAWTFRIEPNATDFDVIVVAFGDFFCFVRCSFFSLSRSLNLFF